MDMFVLGQDRVIFHRLEHICYTVEHGEWPFARRPPSFLQTTPYDSRSATPVGGSTPRPDSASESGEAAELNQVMHPLGGDQSQKDFEVRLSQVGQAACYWLCCCCLPACLSACLILVYRLSACPSWLLFGSPSSLPSCLYPRGLGCDSCWGSFPFCYLTVCHPSLLIVLSLVGAASQAVCSTDDCWGTVFFFHLTVCPLVEQPSMSVDCTVICGAASPLCLYSTVICGAASPICLYSTVICGAASPLCLYFTVICWGSIPICVCFTVIC